MKKHVYKKTSIERVHPEGRRLSYEIADKIKINLYSISSFLNIVKVVIIRNPEKIQTKA